MATLTEIYDRKVAEGTLRADAGQRSTLPLLETIRTALETQPPKPKGFLARLTRKPAEPIRGLYLWGGVGRGKSMLMDLFMESVDIPEKRRVHFHAFMQEVQAGLNDARARGVQDAILPVAEKIATELRLLCFDEMQITDIADAMIVGRLFQKLFDAGVVVVTTSNRAPDDLYKDGLNRQLFLPFIALLKERLAVHEIESETDYRQHRLSGAPVYFSPANAAAAAAIDGIWNDLTGHAPKRPMFLKVNGREVEIPAFHNGVARARFWDLCAKPLGPADYLALTGAARVLILEEIPRLSRSNFNEAKRFVTLIDAVYEARLRFICSAADIPEHLYQEGEGAFEFERTASRLREMQGADWAGATTAA
ncbi:ATPase [Haematobacter missouriensis]|uniref:Cell division protein ZapE n=1 Tax=Haematobacter missouriensis TaxID=366616 RepID=A0A212AJT4_9RHOB|nr:cell division protein ZapE [Haematobacter missouriensis]KFI32589.1 ATPase [Haematobacter missouriensis]OWJ76740.1 cell division protein ZapE [Haematobacter missouriensis]OWJ81762.1 cell division protein ZapE [Haematobacter missouriensis]